MAKKAKHAIKLTLEEPGTLHRQAQAMRMGDVPEDAPSTDTPGTAVRKYTITDRLSWLCRRGVICPRAQQGGDRWRQDWITAGKEPRVTARWDDAPRSTYADFTRAKLEAGKRFIRAGEILNLREYAACFDAAIRDEYSSAQRLDLRAGLWALADWYAVPVES